MGHLRFRLSQQGHPEKGTNMGPEESPAEENELFITWTNTVTFTKLCIKNITTSSL